MSSAPPPTAVIVDQPYYGQQQQQGAPPPAYQPPPPAYGGGQPPPPAYSDQQHLPTAYGVLPVQQGFAAQPQEYGVGMSSVNSILSSYPYVKVVQRFQALEAITQGIFEQPNRYDVFGGNDAESATVPLLLAEEKSEGCTRCCCAPCHSTLVLVKSPNEPGQVLMTLERPGTECFTNGCGPKPLLCCFACTDGCTDEVVIHDGEVQGRPGDMGSGVARISQPIGGGGFTPTLFVTGSDQNVAGDGVITGPCCLGGCLELCLDTNFKYHREEKGEQIGTIIHLRPPCCTSACLTELCTDSDKFGMDMINSFKPENKAKALAALLLIDYMFFERDNGIIACRPAGGGQSGCTLQITLFLCYCYGCLIPCNLSIPLHKSDE